MSILILFAAALGPDPAAAQALKTRPCSTAARSISQVAYAAYRSPVFGSDGLTCTTVKGAPASKAPGFPRAGEARTTPVLRGLGQKP